jgi:hypothetical protein
MRLADYALNLAGSAPLSVWERRIGKRRTYHLSRTEATFEAAPRGEITSLRRVYLLRSGRWTAKEPVSFEG